MCLSASQQGDIATYHADLLASLASRFDVDISQSEKQLSLGMKIVSLLGALGLAASIFFLCYRFWGNLTTSTQVSLLVTAPLLGLLATIYASSRETTGYFAMLFGMLSVTCFVLNLSMLGQIFNIVPSDNVFLVWGAFTFCLAYALSSRLVLAWGILFLAGYVSVKTGQWNDWDWLLYLAHRPENFFPVALLLFGISFLPHHTASDFCGVYRVFALLLFFIPVLFLSYWGGDSYFAHFSPASIEIFYQIVGFCLSALAIWAGIRKHWGEVVNTSTAFFTLFLCVKFVDWWWDSLPKYLFFFILGSTCILILCLLKVFRKYIARNEDRGTS